jgi:hypothetical protein
MALENPCISELFALTISCTFLMKNNVEVYKLKPQFLVHEKR